MNGKLLFINGIIINDKVRENLESWCNQMKTNKYKLGVMLLTLILIITGCKKALPPESAGILFVNRLIYEERDPRFSKNFVEGIGLETEMQNQRLDLTKDLVTSFNEFGGVISSKQTENFLKVWLEKVNSETYYDVKKVTYDKKNKTEIVEFEITGLDFQKIYKKTMDKLVVKMLADGDLVKNNVKLGDLTIELLSESMAEAELISKPTKGSLTLKKVKKKWQLSEESQKEETATLLLAFMVGVTDTEEYAKQMSAAVTEAVNEAMNQVEEEHATGKDKPKAPTKTSQSSSEQLTSAEKADQVEKEQKEKEKNARTSVTEETIETYEEESSETTDSTK